MKGVQNSTNDLFVKFKSNEKFIYRSKMLWLGIDIKSRIGRMKIIYIAKFIYN